jgi:hypothetical protein
MFAFLKKCEKEKFFRSKAAFEHFLKDSDFDNFKKDADFIAFKEKLKKKVKK